MRKDLQKSGLLGKMLGIWGHATAVENCSGVRDAFPLIPFFPAKDY